MMLRSDKGAVDYRAINYRKENTWSQESLLREFLWHISWPVIV